jgi:hypothetical protein
MTKRHLGLLLVATLLPTLAGCSVLDDLQTRTSTAQTCEATVEILADMSEVTLLLVTNPFGYESYATELKSLSSELDGLEPRDPELKEAIDELSAEISTLIDGIGGSSSAGQIAESVAEAQLSFREIASLCESSLLN